MNNGMDKNDILETLKFIDKKIGNNINSKNENTIVEITLVGGSAISLGYNSPRYTFDIDCLPINPEELNEQFKKIGFDVLTSTFLLLPDEYKDRRNEVDGFENIKVYTISAIDLILSKLSRGSYKDQEDCRWLIKNGYVTVEELVKEFLEWKKYYPFNEDKVQTTFDLIVEGF